MFKKLFIICFLLLPIFSYAQGLLLPESKGIVPARVISIESETEKFVETFINEGATTTVQILRSEILSSPYLGDIVLVENDFKPLKEGQKFFASFFSTREGDVIWGVQEPDRRGALLFFVGLFIFVVILFSGFQGLRALASLLGSFVVIFYLLLPQLLNGVSPVILSSVVALIILALAIYFTHGVNRESHAALLGTFIAIIITSVLAYLAVYISALTGYASEEATFLNLNTRGSLQFEGLLLAGIIIGVIGVLDDIAVTQVAAVSELHHSAPSLSKLDLYKKALRIGRDHVSALVNTLVFAYTGAALPLLLLFSQSDIAFSLLINREIFATEIIRTIVGSIGLILTVPISTLIGIFFIYGRGHEPIIKHHH